MRRMGMLVVAGALGLGAVACSNSVSKADFKKQLDEAGMGSTVDTQCLVDKLEAKGFQFRKYGDLSPEDSGKVTEATTECITLTVPSVPSIPSGG
jgi:hypothetical protein